MSEEWGMPAAYGRVHRETDEKPVAHPVAVQLRHPKGGPLA